MTGTIKAELPDIVKVNLPTPSAEIKPFVFEPVRKRR